MPVFRVIDAPIKLSTLSKAASSFNDNDIAVKLRPNESSSNFVFSFFVISSRIFLDSDVSFWLNANSPSVATFRAAASLASMLTVSKRWEKSNIFSSAFSSCFFTLSNSCRRDEHAQRFSWLSLFAQNSSIQL